MKVYCGAAIDTANGDPKEIFERMGSWGNAASALLTSSPSDIDGTGIVMFNPLGAYLNARLADTVEDYKYVYSCNMFALKQSDMALFVVGDAPSVGLPCEIMECWKAEIPTLTVYLGSKPPGLYLKLYCQNRSYSKMIIADSLDQNIESEIIDYLAGMRKLLSLRKKKEAVRSTTFLSIEKEIEKEINEV